jgi:rare lipoprotein A
VNAGEPLGMQRGTASWYGSECSKTASGEQYNPSAMTAAHRSLPFGTMVQVKNLSTGCSATVRINDRGPYRKSRVIDVSKAAAQQLKMIQSGTAKVEFCVLK